MPSSSSSPSATSSPATPVKPAAPTIAFCSVFPKIGIARLGDSEEFFIGPEAPGVPADAGDGFKDSHGRVKRQAARFHVYGFDAGGKVVSELTAANTGSIQWNVAIANKKASWYEFAGTKTTLRIFEGTASDEEKTLRNNDWPSDRRALIMKSTGSVAGVDQVSPALEGTIYDLADPVYLGELRTDDAGRLIFLGACGKSAPRSDDEKYLISHYANNDGWRDDTTDGSVNVDVTLPDGTAIPVKGQAWVIVAPPDYSPHTQNLVTLYDVMEEVALREGLPWHLASTSPPLNRTRVSFVDDVYPILARVVDLQWVNERALRGHGPGKRANFLGDEMLGPLANDKDDIGAKKRADILGLIRNPNLSGADAAKQATLFFMPQLSGDEGDASMGEPNKWLTLTKRQYEVMSLWAQNKFDGYASLKDLKKAIQPPTPFERIPCKDQPFALTKAALLACVGGPFFPGIEMTSICRSKRLYQAAFELSATLEPGDVAKWMALPWQADFYECNTHWWPAQRPDAVVSEFDYREAVAKFPIEDDASTVATLLFPRKQWDRGVGLDRTMRPQFDWPALSPSQSVADYAQLAQESFITFTKAQWTFRGQWWRLPRPKAEEALSRYQFRIREYLDHYGSAKHWPFEIPAAHGGETTKGYRERLIEAFGSFIEGLVPQPSGGETVEGYLSRLSTADSAWMNFVAASVQLGYETRGDYQGDNEMVFKWSNLGFVTRVQGIPERILVETGRGKYDGLRDRDYFYIMLNLDSYPDFEPKARKLAHEFLKAAQDLEKTKQFKSDPASNIYEFFEYSPSAFEARLQQIYEYWSDIARQTPGTRSRTALVAGILQFAPFNQLDGAWLRYSTNAGPISDVNSLLFEIWSDETGNGDPALNHSNLYTSLLHSVGIYLPDIRSRDYAYNPAMFDSAYSNALFELVISQFSDALFPEILGMTLNLEWEVLSLWPGVKRLEAANPPINSQFYRMHIGIDNAVYGHGAKAKKAVQQYLDYIRKESGPEEVVRQWKRIWTAYVAFATTGDVSDDLAVQRDYPPTVETRMIAMIQQKKYFAQRNHSNLPALGVLGNRMNDWFEDPEAFLDTLATSKYIKPGDPDNSYLLSNRTTYEGPMYKIFSPAELALWAEWVRWLAREYQPTAPGPNDPGSRMEQLVRTLSSVASNVPAHLSRQLTGTLSGNTVTQSVADWFRAGPQPLMSALSNPGNGWIVPNSAATSKFITDLLPSAPSMSETIRNTQVAGIDGVTVIQDWINAGCPMPGGQQKPLAQAPTVPLALDQAGVMKPAQGCTSAFVFFCCDFADSGATCERVPRAIA